MGMTSRYSDIAEVKIDPGNVPEQFRDLIPLAMVWCIQDDVELDGFIHAASDEEKRTFRDAFAPHFDALWKWCQEFQHVVPQPDELVVFDIASNAAATVDSLLG